MKNSIAFIPEIDSSLLLTDDHSFSIFKEYRNSNLYKLDGKTKEKNWNDVDKSYDRPFPKGSIFKIDRIYVRNGKEEFSSITLQLISTSDPAFANVANRNLFGKKFLIRFWIKLSDFNKAKFEVIEDKTLDHKLVPHKGKVLTFGEFKPKKKWPEYWVEFVHHNPSQNMSGYVLTRKNENEYYYVKPTGEKTHDYGYYGLNKPEHFVNSLWIYNQNQDNEKINIPTDKERLNQMGITDNSSLMENLSIAGGKLSIYSVEWK